MNRIAWAFAIVTAAIVSGCATETPVKQAATPPPPPAAAPKPAPAPVAKPAPAPKPAPKPATFIAKLEADGSFEKVKPGGKLQLTPAAKAKLDSEVIGKAKQLARVDAVIVAGHSDRLHMRSQRLSEQQAEAVLAHLKSQGLQAPVMDTMGFGKTLPVKECPSTTPKKELAACLAPNRRVEVEVKGMPR